MSFINANTFSKPEVTLASGAKAIYPELMEFVADNTNTLEIKLNSNTAIQFAANQVTNFVGPSKAICLPVGTTAQRPVPAAVGMIRFNTELSGGGGVEAFDGSLWGDLLGYYFGQLVVVGGGGGGGPSGTGGGGGAGGVISTTVQISPGTNTAVIVGNGGTTTSSTASNGGNSSWAGLIVAFGGGFGGYSGSTSTAAGGLGGSGGGMLSSNNAAQYGAYGRGIPGQGFDGGYSINSGNFSSGGGAGDIGQFSQTAPYTISGGKGIINPIPGSNTGEPQFVVASGTISFNTVFGNKNGQILVPSNTVTGTGTSFTTQLNVGSKLIATSYFGGANVIVGTIQSIENNTSLTLTQLTTATFSGPGMTTNQDQVRPVYSALSGTSLPSGLGFYTTNSPIAYWLGGGGGAPSTNQNQAPSQSGKGGLLGPGSQGGLGGGGQGGYFYSDFQLFNNLNYAGSPGMPNTGGGGGATGQGLTTGGIGGSGCVILSVPTSRYALATVKGSYYTTVSGANTIVTWTYPGGFYVA
jgi:hypothetical protein